MLQPTTVCIVLVIAATAAASDRRVALMPIRTSAVDAALAPSLDAVLGVELEALGGFEVITAADIESMLDFERQREFLSCDDACIAEIGGALGVDRIVRTHIGRLGDSFVLDMALIDTAAGRTEARIYETVAAREGELIALIRRSVARLVASSTPEPRAEEPAARRDAAHPAAGSATAEPKLAAQTSTSSLGGWLTAAGGAAAIVGGL